MEKPTTDITINIEQADALIIAISDSLTKIGFFRDMDIDQFRGLSPEMSEEALQEEFLEVRETGDHLLAIFNDFTGVLVEARRELAETEKTLLEGKIVGLDKKPLF